MDRPEFAFETAGYQYTNQVVRLEFNLDDPLFAKPAVRRAVASVIDRDALIDRAWLGFGKPAIGPISPDLVGFHDDSLAPLKVDLAEAERYLDEAGLPRGPDGIRARLPIDYVPAGDGYRRSAEYISEVLKKIGINAAVRSQDFGGYVKRIYADRDFHFAVSRMNNMFDPARLAFSAYIGQRISSAAFRFPTARTTRAWKPMRCLKVRRQRAIQKSGVSITIVSRRLSRTIFPM
jgi:peptide/nickel transport system substrate-binding protein